MRADEQLLSSILLGSVSLIPNNILRCTALGFVIAFVLIYNLYLKRGRTRLHQLEHSIQRAEDIFERAKSMCAHPRDQFRLAEEWVRLLE
jgi:uncharacterized membrane protein YciS (DUF1049 family)